MFAWILTKITGRRNEPSLAIGATAGGAGGAVAVAVAAPLEIGRCSTSEKGEEIPPTVEDEEEDRPGDSKS